MQTKRDHEEREGGGESAYVIGKRKQESFVCSARQAADSSYPRIFLYAAHRNGYAQETSNTGTPAHTPAHTWQIFTLALTFALALTLAARPRLRFIFGLGICFL